MSHGPPFRCRWVRGWRRCGRGWRWTTPPTGRRWCTRIPGDPLECPCDIRISNVEARNFIICALTLGNQGNPDFGISNVLVDHAWIHHNGSDGVDMTGSAENVEFACCRIEHQSIGFGIENDALDDGTFKLANLGFTDCTLSDLGVGINLHPPGRVSSLGSPIDFGLPITPSPRRL